MRWDIFCRVIDNHGDLGVCWRLAADLAGRGDRVRLWVDDPSALAWMAPDGAPGVELRPWTTPLGAAALASVDMPDALVEAFGCDIAPEFIAHCARLADAGARKPAWLNLEYLTAEPYAARCHGLPSPVQHGPAAGWTKWFFYPGFTADTGGLLREPGIGSADDETTEHSGDAAPDDPSPQQVTLFCYEPPALSDLLARLAEGPGPARLRALPGRPVAAVNRILSSADRRGALMIERPAPRPQAGFDDWLRRSDLNFVRGEDSLVRALWAGRPFVWQIYPQDGGVHAAKLDAFLDWLDAPADLRRFHHVWNGLRPGPLPPWDLPAWGAVVRTARVRALQVPDLATQLRRFAIEKQ
ncbi:elongation factor P maturation arginine rhamnosyltransferase EarP [uncultured Xylophilus sp.]|uniref:elongation factor P maturation arginine rhamnosyltransferase EarP n=1 Tax=uncultured Xylophilus sp. TaxID=296832 RepID=UPI0025D95B3B|nr:elongation factor P maturation arginine rhamnosyltransferase EarP [uncultured Xylophilus sp.]